MAEAILTEQIEQTVEGLGPLELVVGIPSYNNVSTIGQVVKAAQAGLASYFGNRKALIVNPDADSNDGTPEAVEGSRTEGNDALLRVKYLLEPVHRLTTPYHGLPGKGSAFRTLFQIVQATQARALAVVEADLSSVTPEWFKSLLEPILSLDFDYVAPYYQRHKYDGTMTNRHVLKHWAVGQSESTGQAQQQPQAFPFHAARPSFRSNGMAASAASESNQAIWKSALIARPARAITAR